MRKNYTSKFKAETVIEVLREAKTLNEIAVERQVHPNLVGKWKKEVLEKLATIFDDEKKKERGEKKEQEKIINELYAQIGELTTKLNWLKKKSGINI